MHKYHIILIVSFITAHTIAMQQNQENNLDTTKLEQQVYIGTHGWTIDTHGNKENVVIHHDNEYELRSKIAIVRNFAKYKTSSFLIQQKDRFNHYITHQGLSSKLRIIDIQSGQKEATLCGHTDTIHSCTSTDYENIIASGSQDRTVKIWNANNHKCLQTLSGHNKSVMHIASEQGTLASIDESPSIKLWDIPSGTCKHTQLLTSKPLSLMMYATLIYISFINGTIMVIDPRCESFAWQAHEKLVTCLLPCKQVNHILYSGSSDQTIKQWDWRNNSSPFITLQQENKLPLPKYAIQNIYEDYEGTKIFSSDMNTVYVWDISQIEPTLVTTKSLHPNIASNSLNMNADETELYIATSEGIKTLTPNFDFKTLKKLQKRDNLIPKK